MKRIPRRRRPHLAFRVPAVRPRVAAAVPTPSVSFSCRLPRSSAWHSERDKPLRDGKAHTQEADRIAVGPFDADLLTSAPPARLARNACFKTSLLIVLWQR
jgi:hypothetical protein